MSLIRLNKFLISLLGCCLFILISTNGFSQTEKKPLFEKYVVLIPKSNVEWSANTLKGANNGSIGIESGYFLYRNGIPVAGEVVVNMYNIGISSMPPGVASEQILGLMRAPNFLDVATFPTAKIELTTIKAINFNDFEVNGFFTVKGFRGPIKFRTVIDHHDDIIEAKTKSIRISRDTYKIGTTGNFEFPNSKGAVDEAIDKFFQVEVNIIAEKENSDEQ